MANNRKFRFGVQMSRAGSADAWREKARKLEDLGYASLFIPDHFEDQFAPMPALMAAADATSTLRVGTLVLDNDYRHPLVLAKEIATLDLLSNGRVEFGIGAGWMKTDYDASGMVYESPGVRIEKLKEGLAICKGLFASEGPFSYAGKHYTITAAKGLPKPVQTPHPPVLIGGGRPRVLKFAAREADIIGFNFSLHEGAVNRETMVTGTAAATDEKIGWVREGAGARMDELEMNVTVFVCVVTDDRASMAERISGGFGMPAAEVLESPHAVIGSVDQIVEDIQRRRERWGFSYVVFSGDVADAMAPVVKKLAGT
ncbi:MAG: TIGR03621 family F420-dependent LLM class oxidoreductase [Dehalococcoidia bacterium]